MTQLYIQASMYRSGSTLMFNVVRLILEKAYGKENVYSCFKEQYKPTDPRPYHLVKIHRRNEKLLEQSTKVFSTIREKEEVKKSMKRRAEINKDERFTSETNLEKFDKFWDDFLWWKGQSKTITFNYWQLVSALPVVVAITADQMGLLEKLEDDIIHIANEVKSLKPPTEGYDKETLLHANHITK